MGKGGHMGRHFLCSCSHGEAAGVVGGSKEIVDKAMNPEEILAMDTLLSKQLVDGLIALLAEVPLL